MSIYIPSLDKNIYHGHSKKALSEAITLLQNGVKDSCKNRISVEGYTIDGKESRDLDDGIFVEKTSFGYKLQISISDVSEIVPRNSLIEKGAFDKATSIYLPTHVNHMLPENISTGVASLNHLQETLALTIEVEIDRDFNVISSKLFESKFHNLSRFDYESYSDNLLNKQAKFNDELLVLLELSNGLYKKRVEKEVNFNFYDAQRKIYPGKSINTYTDVQKHLAAFCVEQIALTGNNLAAKFAIENKVDVLFRNHMPEYRDNRFEGGEMQRAFYNEDFSYHLGLKERDGYMHFTSPIRRLADFISHINLKKALRGEQAEYTKEDIRDISLFINERIYQVINFEKDFTNEVKEKKESRFIKKIESGLEISEKELFDISIHRMDEIIHKFLSMGKEFPEFLEKEIDRRFQVGLMKRETIFLFLFSGREKYTEKAVGVFSGKYKHMNRNPKRILSFINNYLVKKIDFKVNGEYWYDKDDISNFSLKLDFKSDKLNISMSSEGLEKYVLGKDLYMKLVRKIAKSGINFFAD